METNLPRICAGAISAMYIGERLEANPMARPPKIRQTTKMQNEDSPANPVPSEEIAKRNADNTSNRLRPKRSLRTPEANAPDQASDAVRAMRHGCQPAAAMLRSVSAQKTFRRKALAPPMTTQS